MRKKGFALILLFVFAFSLLYSNQAKKIDETLIKIYKDSNGPIFYPDSFIYTLLNKYSVCFNKKTKEIKEEYVDFYQILNRAGRDRYSDYKIRYIKDKEKLSVLRAFTLNKDLSFIEVEKGAINTVTPIGLERAALYSNILDKVYSFQNVDPEDAIYIKYRKVKKSKNGFLGSLFTFQEDNPINEKILEIKLPKDMKLYLKVKNEGKDKKIEKQTEDTAENKIYRFKMKEIQKIKPEEYRASDFYISPTIFYSTSKNWSKVVNSLYKKYDENSSVSKDIKNQVNKIIKGAKSKEEKLEKIYKFISSEIKYIPLPLGLDGYFPHKASVVLKNAYGDLRDKTVLFMAMLKSIGYKPMPVFVNTMSAPEKELVILSQFNYILVRINNNGKNIYLNPNGENSVVGYTGIADDTEALLICKNPEWVKIKNSVPSCVSSEFNINLKENNDFEAIVSIKTKGYFDSLAKRIFKLSSEDEKNKAFSQYANVFNEGAEDVGYTFKNLKSLNTGVELKDKIKGKDFYVKQGNVVIINIPDNPYPFAVFPFNLSLKERHYPIYFGRKMTIKENWKIKSDEKFKPLYLPEKMEIDNENYSFKISSFYKDGVINILREIKIKNKMLTPSEYLQFKKSYDKFNNWKLKTLLLEKIK